MRPNETDSRDLGLLLDLHFKEKFSVKEASSIHLHRYMDILLIRPEDIEPEESVSLRNNNQYPVIMLSDQPQDDLIQEHNIFRSTEGINPAMIPLIKESVEARDLISQSVGPRPEVFYNLETAIEKELKEARERKETISSFEALYNILRKKSEEILVSAKRSPQEIIFEQLNTRVMPFLEQFEKRSALHYIAEAQENFRLVLHVIKEAQDAYRRIGNEYNELEFLVGGSTVSEQGIRCLIAINPRKKYNLTDGPHGYFLRDVFNRKGIDHVQIAKIRYDTQKYLAELFEKKNNGASEVGKFAKMYHPLSYDPFTYLIQEALIGPDLEYVLLKIRDAIPESDEAELLHRVRDEIIKKYLDDLVGWQKHTLKIVDEDAKKMGRKPEVVARYFKNNLRQILKQYNSHELADFSKSELELWDNCLTYLNPHLLGISKSSVVLSQDSSSKNAILHIGRKFPSIKELLDAVTTKNRNPSRKKIDDIFYHVDTGFVVTHFLEDFFHIVDAYEACDKDMEPARILEHRQKWYKHFCKKKKITPSPIVLNLAGAYRNMRRAFLVVKEFQNKNIRFAREGIFSENTYNNFRRSYEQMNDHHMTRAVLYLDELKTQFRDLARKTNSETGEIKEKYEKITSLAEMDEDSAREANEFVTNLQYRIQNETSRKKKKYLSSILHGTMGHCMARLAEQTTKIKLSNYETARRGVSDE